MWPRGWPNHSYDLGFSHILNRKSTCHFYGIKGYLRTRSTHTQSQCPHSGNRGPRATFGPAGCCVETVCFLLLAFDGYPCFPAKALPFVWTPKVNHLHPHPPTHPRLTPPSPQSAESTPVQEGCSCFCSPGSGPLWWGSGSHI